MNEKEKRDKMREESDMKFNVTDADGTVLIEAGKIRGRQEAPQRNPHE